MHSNEPSSAEQHIPDWYYSNNGSQSGPISQSDITSLIAEDQISRHILVWRPGLPGWLTAEQAGMLPPEVERPSKGRAFLREAVRVTLTGCAFFLGVALIFPLAPYIFGPKKKHIEHIESSPPRAMPLTMDSIREFGVELNKPFEEISRSMFLENDLTKPVVAAKAIQTNPRFESASFDREIIRRMGYDYNLTVREIARNRKTLESRVHAGLLILIGGNAAQFKDELLAEKLIDQETYSVLSTGYPQNERQEPTEEEEILFAQ